MAGSMQEAREAVVRLTRLQKRAGLKTFEAESQVGQMQILYDRRGEPLVVVTEDGVISYSQALLQLSRKVPGAEGVDVNASRKWEYIMRRRRPANVIGGL